MTSAIRRLGATLLHGSIVLLPVVIYILSRLFAVFHDPFDGNLYDFLIPNFGLVFLSVCSATLYFFWTRAPRSVSLLPKWMDWLAYSLIVPLSFLIGFFNVLGYYRGNLPMTVWVSCLVVFVIHMTAHLWPMLALNEI